MGNFTELVKAGRIGVSSNWVSRPRCVQGTVGAESARTDSAQLGVAPR